MVDIEINALASSLFLNIETNLILYLYPEIQPIRVAYMKPINLKFCEPFKINIQKWEELFNFKTGFSFFSTISKKERFKKKIKSVSIGYSD